MLTGNGVPNDVISNFNSLSIILLGPCLNVCTALCLYNLNITDCIIHSTVSTLRSAKHVSTMVPLLVSPQDSPSALSPASDTASSATRPTRPIHVAGTAAQIQSALTAAWCRPSHCGGPPFRLPLVDSPSSSSTCLVSITLFSSASRDYSSNTISSIRHRLLPRTRQHERSRLRHQPSQHRFRLRHQPRPVLRHH